MGDGTRFIGEIECRELKCTQLCVTLYDWEHIAERFAHATHYAEKALYKLLAQHLVPAITAELRVRRTPRRLTAHILTSA